MAQTDQPPTAWPLTVYFARAEAASQQSSAQGLRAALEAAALHQQPGQPLSLATTSLPLLRLESDPRAVAPLDAALARSGSHAYLFSSLRAVEALDDLERLDALDRHAPLFCVGARALAALRAAGFDGPSQSAATAAALENAIIEASRTTSGGSTVPGLAQHLHYFCAREVSHNFAALDAARSAAQSPPESPPLGAAITWHRLYVARDLPDDDAKLQARLLALAERPERALVLVYSRALARRLGQLATALESCKIAPDWRHRLPVLCLSHAIAVELETWDFRSISVAQTPNEEGLAALLNARLPGLNLRLAHTTRTAQFGPLSL